MFRCHSMLLCDHVLFYCICWWNMFNNKWCLLSQISASWYIQIAHTVVPKSVKILFYHIYRVCPWSLISGMVWIKLARWCEQKPYQNHIMLKLISCTFGRNPIVFGQTISNNVRRVELDFCDGSIAFQIEAINVKNAQSCYFGSILKPFWFLAS